MLVPVMSITRKPSISGQKYYRKKSLNYTIQLTSSHCQPKGLPMGVPIPILVCLSFSSKALSWTLGLEDLVLPLLELEEELELLLGSAPRPACLNSCRISFDATTVGGVIATTE